VDVLAALALGSSRVRASGKPRDRGHVDESRRRCAARAVALPFVAAQFRYALHPQLEAVRTCLRPPSRRFCRDEAKSADTMQAGRKDRKPCVGSDGSATSAGAREPRAKPAAETVTGQWFQLPTRRCHRALQESTIVQTGAASRLESRPKYVLAWSGPVLPSQNVRLLIAPPWLVRVLRIVLVALLAMLIVRLVRGNAQLCRERRFRWRARRSRRAIAR